MQINTRGRCYSNRSTGSSRYSKRSRGSKNSSRKPNKVVEVVKEEK